jgi:hypothetical protein
MRHVSAVLCVPLALAACAGPVPQAAPRLAGQTPAAVAAADCGTFELSQAEHAPATAIDCFVDAVRAGRPAELRITRPTVEGDPIPTTYVAGADRRIEVTTDTTRDNFGPRLVHRQVCVDPVVVRGGLTFAQCSSPVPVR